MSAQGEELFKNLSSVSGATKLLDVFSHLDKSGREIILKALNEKLTDAKKKQFLAMIQTEAVKADDEVRVWVQTGISDVYVAGMNTTSSELASINVLPKDVADKVAETKARVLSSEGVDIEATIARGDMPRDAFYVTGKTLTVRFAAGRIDDIAQKLDKFQAGLGTIFRQQINPANTTMAKLTATGVKVLEDAVKQKFTPVTFTMLNAVNDLRPHLAAINALMSDSYLDFAGTMTGYVKGAERILNDALKRQMRSTIAAGRLDGATVGEIKKTIKETLGTQGFTVLIDRGGRQWELNQYAEMLTRTHIIRANTEGAVNRASDYGVDIMEVSTHGATDEACASEEGQIYSISGNSENYPPLDEHEPPYHPNCAHTLIPRPDLV